MCGMFILTGFKENDVLSGGFPEASQSKLSHATQNIELYGTFFSVHICPQESTL
jgi:hypothetical protein